nr:uncharacterized protein LOC125632190 [Caretta caretta]
MKLKELRQAYQKNREANGRSGSEPQTCHFYDELHAILGGAATTTPSLCFESNYHATGMHILGTRKMRRRRRRLKIAHRKQAEKLFSPRARNCFSPWTWSQYPPEPTQGGLLDPPGREGTSAANVSALTLSSPSQRLAKIRRQKKRTRDEMFSELMQSSHTERSQQSAWRQATSESRKAQYEREDRWWVEDDGWRQLVDRRQETMLRLL